MNLGPHLKRHRSIMRGIVTYCESCRTRVRHFDVIASAVSFSVINTHDDENFKILSTLKVLE